MDFQHISFFNRGMDIRRRSSRLFALLRAHFLGFMSFLLSIYPFACLHPSHSKKKSHDLNDTAQSFHLPSPIIHIYHYPFDAWADPCFILGFVVYYFLLHSLHLKDL